MCLFVFVLSSLFMEEEEWDDTDQIIKVLNCPMMVAKKQTKVLCSVKSDAYRTHRQMNWSLLQGIWILLFTGDLDSTVYRGNGFYWDITAILGNTTT